MGDRKKEVTATKKEEMVRKSKKIKTSENWCSYTGHIRTNT